MITNSSRVATSSNLLDMLENKSAHIHNDILTFIDGTKDSITTYTYKEIISEAKSIAAELQKSYQSGSRAILIYNPGVEYILAFLGCLYAGIVAIPVYKPSTIKADNAISLLNCIISDAEPHILLCESKDIELADIICSRALLNNNISVMPTNTINFQPNKWVKSDIDADTIAFLQYTSGSTSQPKGVMVTHRNLSDNLHAIYSAFQMDGSGKGLIWLPPYHDMGLIGGILAPLFSGFPIVLTTPLSFIRNPLSWLELVSEHKATITGGPNFAFDLCVKKIRDNPNIEIDLSSLEIVFCGAEPISLNTLRDFSRAFEPYGFRGSAIHSCYGLAENTLLATSSLLTKNSKMRAKKFLRSEFENNRAIPYIKGSNDKNVQSIMSCGSSFHGHEIKVVDPKSQREVENNSIGEIWISGPSVAAGYWRQPWATNKTFRAKIVNGKKSRYYLRTGDLGFIDDGELYISGRLKDLIIINGRNYYPNDIEHIAINSHRAISKQLAAAFSYMNNQDLKLVIAVEVPRGIVNNELEKIALSIKKAVSEYLSLYVGNIILVKHNTLSRTTSGKIQRGKIKDLYEKGQVKDIIYQYRNSYITDKSENNVRSSDIYKILTGNADLTKNEILNLRVSQFGLESLQMVALKNAIDADLEIDLDINLMFRADKLTEIIDHITYLKEIDLCTSQMTVQYNNRIEICPLQKSILFEYLRNPNGKSYNLFYTIKCENRVSHTEIVECINALIMKHHNLRSTFDIEEDGIYQIIHDSALKNSVVDLGKVSKKISPSFYKIYKTEKFNIVSGPLAQFYIVTDSVNRTYLIVNIHHIIIDHWSFCILLNEFWNFLKNNTLGVLNESTKREVHPQEFLIKYNDYKNTNQYLKDIEFWKNEYNMNEYYYYEPNINKIKKGIGIIKMKTNKKITDKIIFQSKKLGCTQFSIILTSLHKIFSSLSDHNKIIFGCPFSDRSWKGANSYVGYCVNLLPIKLYINDELSFEESVLKTQTSINNTRLHSQLPLHEIIEKIKPERNMKKMPFFNVIVVYQGGLMNGKLYNLTEEKLGSTEDLQNDLVITIIKINGIFNFRFEYDKSWCDSVTMRTIVNDYLIILEKCLTFPTINSSIYLNESCVNFSAINKKNNTFEQVSGKLNDNIFESLIRLGGHNYIMSDKNNVFKAFVGTVSRWSNFNVGWVKFFEISMGINNYDVNIKTQKLEAEDNTTDIKLYDSKIHVTSLEELKLLLTNIRPISFCRFTLIHLDGLNEDEVSKIKIQCSLSVKSSRNVYCLINKCQHHYYVAWIYFKEEFRSNIIEDMMNSFNMILDRDTYSEESQNLPVSQEKSRYEANSTSSEFIYGDKLIDELFFISVNNNPDTVALICCEKKITYRELFQRSKLLSKQLINLGVKNSSIIAIIMPKSIEQVIAVLGVLFAGCAYLPLEPDLPERRINTLIHTSKSEYILSHEDTLSLCNKVRSNSDGRIISNICVNQQDEDDYLNEHLCFNKRNRKSSDLAYVIFTSGSTGSPKGVMVEHQSVVNTILDINRKFSISKKDIIFGISRLNFDLSVYDIFGTLAAGATLVIPKQQSLKNPQEWSDQIIKHNISVWNSTPMLMQMLVEHTKSHPSTRSAIRDRLRLVMLSGDWMPLTLFSEIRKFLVTLKNQNELQIINLGGATEASIWSNYYEIKSISEDWTSIPYGKPLANQQYYIFDTKLRSCPDWVTGEIYIAGKGLARGYYNDVALTGERFIIHPKLNVRMYKTGDLGRYWPDGNIEFLGRKDKKIKLAGYRIDLREVKYWLEKNDQVSRSEIILAQINGFESLIAFVTLKQDPIRASINQDIIESLKKELPEYAVPQKLFILNEFPLTNNGKLDVGELHTLIEKEQRSKIVKEKLLTDSEKLIQCCWKSILKLDNLDINDNFFQQGGNSLLAVKLSALLSRSFDRSVSVEFIFSFQTIDLQNKNILKCPTLTKDLIVRQKRVLHK